jgi:hypothetical protein
VEEVETGFLERVNPVIAGFTLLAAFASLLFLGLYFAIGVLAGGAFAILNTKLIAGLVKVTLADVRKPRDIILAFSLKFPLIYGILVFLFAKHIIDPGGFAVGFTLLLVGFVVIACIDSRTANKTVSRSSREDKVR